jgi:hypothetical protein
LTGWIIKIYVKNVNKNHLHGPLVRIGCCLDHPGKVLEGGVAVLQRSLHWVFGCHIFLILEDGSMQHHLSCYAGWVIYTGIGKYAGAPGDIQN